MVFSFLKKQIKCPVCGQEIQKKEAIFQFGKYFCSEECLERYKSQKEFSDPSSGRKGSCCG